MTKLPIICKHVCSYTYAKVTKYRPLYVLLLEYNYEEKSYYANFIKEDGRLYGRHYDRWIAWDDETIRELEVAMEELPERVRKTVREQIEVFKEVKRRCTKKPQLKTYF